MDVLVLGSGGREHALAWRIRLSPSASRVYVAPGNPGTAHVGTNVTLDLGDFREIAEFVKSKGIQLVVVGPENPLADGIADYLRSCGISTFGPGREGARLEASKTFAKEFMVRHGIPHPSFRTFDNLALAEDYLQSTPGPWVIKADGLALGKGVSIVSDLDHGRAILRDTMSGRVHGEAGKRVIIEEFLTGREVSAMALCDGTNLLPLPLAKDHKRVFDGDEGPMTGGMGAYSPVPFVDAGTFAFIRTQVLQRTLAGLRAECIEFRGLLYAGLMLTADGPKVLEYNVRFGDPETQCVLPRLSGDFCKLLAACADGCLLDAIAPQQRGAFAEGADTEGIEMAGMDEGRFVAAIPEACVSVVLASGGYPGPYKKGVAIDLGDGPGHEESIIFHAGTSVENGKLVTSGGRVLAVTALAPSVEEAAEKAYRVARTVEFEGKSYRRDIGKAAWK